jgi:putative flippase GtrA
MAEQFRFAATVVTLVQVLRRPSRYVQIGLICALLSNALVIGLDQLGVRYLVSTISATLTVTVVGYLLHSAYTFRVTPSFAALLRFFGATAVGSCLAILLMIILCGGFGLVASAAIPIATVIMFIWNFAFASWAIAGPARSHRGSDSAAARS